MSEGWTDLLSSLASGEERTDYQDSQWMFSTSMQWWHLHHDSFATDRPKLSMKDRGPASSIINIQNRPLLTLNRIGSFGMSWRSTPMLPLLTANIEVKLTKLSSGLGILKRNGEEREVSEGRRMDILGRVTRCCYCHHRSAWRQRQVESIYVVHWCTSNATKSDDWRRSLEDRALIAVLVAHQRRAKSLPSNHFCEVKLRM